MHYRLNEAPHWCQLDEEWVVYLPDAGVLTALDSFNGAVLDSVERGASGASQVAAALARDCGDDVSDALTEKVGLVMAALTAAGLLQLVAE